VRGAITARGGVLREPSSTMVINLGLGNAGAIGDLIHYRDGSTARIVSGLGLAEHHDYRPLAFVGSELDNGDTLRNRRSTSTQTKSRNLGHGESDKSN